MNKHETAVFAFVRGHLPLSRARSTMKLLSPFFKGMGHNTFELGIPDEIPASAFSTIEQFAEKTRCVCPVSLQTPFEKPEWVKTEWCTGSISDNLDEYLETVVMSTLRKYGSLVQDLAQNKASIENSKIFKDLMDLHLKKPLRLPTYVRRFNSGEYDDLVRDTICHIVSIWLFYELASAQYKDHADLLRKLVRLCAKGYIPVGFGGDKNDVAIVLCA